MKRFITFYLLGTAICLGIGSNVVAATINGYNFDLNQFVGATVTTNVANADIYGNTWDNLAGVDLYTLGELATPQFGVDPGDHISLGDHGIVDWLTLSYGTGFYVGTGESALFVVYESSGRLPGQDDPGRTGWNISFNGGAAIDVSVANPGISTSLYSGHAPSQGQIVFDLTQLGFGVGSQINSVRFTNHLGIGPDFIFAAHAGTSTPPVVPLPAPAAMGLLGIALTGLVNRRKARSIK